MATSDLANELAKESFRFDNPAAEKQASGRPSCAGRGVPSHHSLRRQYCGPLCHTLPLETL